MKVGAAAVIGGALIAGKFLVDSIGEAREAQKVSALTASTIKSTGGAAKVTAKQVSDLAGAISLKTGVDDETIQSGENMLLTFKNIRNEAGKGNDIFDQSTKTLIDFSSAMGTEPKQAAIQLGKALNDPVKGVTALGRAGVQFTDQQKKQIETMVESGRTMEAQKLILGELNSQFGGAAEAQATAGEKAKVAWDNLQEAVGTALLPTLDKVLNLFTEFVVFLTTRGGPALFKIKNFFADLGGSGGAGGLVTALAGVAASIRTNFLPVLHTVVNTFQTSILPAVQRLVGYLRANLIPIFIQYAEIIRSQVVPIIAALAKYLYGTVYPAVVRIATVVATKLKPAFDQLFLTIRTEVLPSARLLLAKLREWGPTIAKVSGFFLKLTEVQTKFSASILGKVLPPVIKFGGILIRNTVKTLIIAIEAIAKAIGWLGDLGAAFNRGVQVASNFAEGVGNKVGAAIAVIQSLPGKARDALGNLGSMLYQSGQDLVQGLIDGIQSKIPAVVVAMSGLAGVIANHMPGSPVKTGPLTAWNNTGPTGPGGRLVGLLADGLGNTGSVTSAMDRLSAGIAVRGPGVLAAAGAGGGGRAVFHIYDRDDVLLGTMEGVADGRIHGANQLTGETARAM